MDHEWQLLCAPPTGLVVPARVGTPGGPTPSAARFGGWQQVGSGLYVPADTDSSVVEQRILEKSCLIRGAVVTGWAALRLHGSNLSDGLAGDGSTLLDVQLVGRQSSRQHEGIRYRRRVTPASLITTKHGIRCTTALQATIDAMCWAADLRESVKWGDIACSAGLVSVAELVLAVHSRRARGIEQARAAVKFVTDRSRSPAETAMRLIWVLDAQLPPPLCNWPVLTLAGAWVANPDGLGVQINIYGEFDGRDHRKRKQQATDVDRDTKLQDLGLEGFRIVGQDLLDTGLVVSRMHSAANRAAQSQRPQLWRPGDRPRRLT